MNLRKEIRFLTFTLVVLAVPIIGFIVYKSNLRRRQECLKTLIENLESYKSKYGKYPNDLSDAVVEQMDWLYYSPDSLNHTFYLSYSSGIMNANTFTYNSMTKKWEELFNY